MQTATVGSVLQTHRRVSRTLDQHGADLVYRFTLISAMYNVARYLPDYFASLEKQTHGLDDVQVVLVDDGSQNDDTLAVAERFAATRSNVVVVHKENGGQASARNAGLDVAEGEWVSFPDPDDLLQPSYLASIARAMDHDHDGSSVYAARVLQWDETNDVIKDNHALGFRARNGDVRVNLEEQPDHVQPHVVSAFFRLDHLRETGIRFDERLRLRFEDGSFATRYLLSIEPTVFIAPSAEYLYRHRADGSSTVQSSNFDQRKYVDAIKYGYLGVIEAAERFGHEGVPLWAQNLMLYDQFWILRSSFYGAARNTTFGDAVHAELTALLEQFLDHMDEQAIEQFSLMPVSDWMRDVFLLGKRRSGFGAVRRNGVDRVRGLVPYEYSFRGPQPRERILANGVPIQARHSKSMALEYVGRPFAWKRTLWVTADADITVELDGTAIAPVGAETARGLDRAGSGLGAKLARQLARTARIASRGRRIGVRESMRRVGGIVAGSAFARRFADAWVFIDRDVDSNDSAEVLYDWVVRNHPEINAWFVVRAGTPDWERLSKAGARLVAYGTPTFYALLRHAKHLASSHADRFITNALPRSVGRPQWLFTFLQHGVIKGDISRWLNGKKIDVFVTSTQGEYDYITGPSPFKFGTRETRLLGLPRFDDLMVKDAAVPAEAKNVILIAPTWRDYLVGDMSTASNKREILDEFLHTAYATNLLAVLRSERLRELVVRHDAEVIFLPHPNMRAYLDSFDVPSHVKLQTYDDEDVRALLARTAVLVTDYSSMSFNLAYMQRPTIYFQFDRDEYMLLHTERPGYFVYEDDGFGPVLEQPEHVIDELENVLSGRFDPKYTDRMHATFPVRDGRNSERVFEAMRALSDPRPTRRADNRVAVVPDSWENVAEAAAKG